MDSDFVIDFFDLRPIYVLPERAEDSWRPLIWAFSQDYFVARPEFGVAHHVLLNAAAAHHFRILASFCLVETPRVNMSTSSVVVVAKRGNQVTCLSSGHLRVGRSAQPLTSIG